MAWTTYECEDCGYVEDIDVTQARHFVCPSCQGTMQNIDDDETEAAQSAEKAPN